MEFVSNPYNPKDFENVEGKIERNSSRQRAWNFFGKLKVKNH